MLVLVIVVAVSVGSNVDFIVPDISNTLTLTLTTTTQQQQQQQRRRRLLQQQQQQQTKYLVYVHSSARHQQHKN